MADEWVRFDRYGVRVERLRASAGPFRYTTYHVTFAGCWRIDFCDWSLSRRVSSREWMGIGPSFRCVFCQRFTLGCDEHWFCGVCRGCHIWDNAPAMEEGA